MGELSNAIVPPFSEEIAALEKKGDENGMLYGWYVLCSLLVVPVFGAEDINEEAIEEYLSDGREKTLCGNDFLLQVLYDCDFNTKLASEKLKKVYLGIESNL